MDKYIEDLCVVPSSFGRIYRVVYTYIGHHRHTGVNCCTSYVHRSW
jgi:hypothetical protein